MHFFSTGKQLCETMGLTLIPAPTTLHEMFIQNFYDGFADIIVTGMQAVDSSGTDLDETIVLKWANPKPLPDGCIGITQANVRSFPCGDPSPFALQPVCLIP